MKITIAYLPVEEREADLINRFVQGLLSIEKVRKSDRHPLSAPVIKCKKRPRKKCSFVAEVKGKR